jgi:hypothetical protein
MTGRSAASNTKEPKMKMKIALASLTFLTVGSFSAITDSAHAVVYCTYISYPANCVVRPGVVLRPRPVARAAVVHGTPMNRGGPVNRVGRR